MCSICHTNPCLSRCPNASEPMTVTVCYYCGEPIVSGDKYLQNNGDDYCEACIENMSRDELINLFGGEWKIAEEEDWNEYDR